MQTETKLTPMKRLKGLALAPFMAKPPHPVTCFGSVDQWHVVAELLTQDSNIVCAGVGTYITFEKELASRTGASMDLFDPSPIGIETMELPENQDLRFQFYPIGLAGEDSSLGFTAPEKGPRGSWTLQSQEEADNVFKCRSLSSWMAEKGWETLDLLKMDIEGFEYEVFEDILANDLDVRQVCVELHTNRFMDIRYTRKDMFLLMRRLRRHGYRLIYWKGQDFTFLKMSS